LGQRGVLLEKNLEADVMHLESIINNQNDFDLKSKKASDWSRKFTLNYFEDEIKKIIQQ
jgi:nitrous oxidase accessory protein NosD